MTCERETVDGGTQWSEMDATMHTTPPRLAPVSTTARLTQRPDRASRQYSSIPFHTWMAVVLACERASAVRDVRQQDNACVIDHKKRVGAISRGRAAA